MAGFGDVPTSAEVRRILVAAADVIFSDGVSDAFLDQWTDETVLLLSLEHTTPPIDASRYPDERMHHR